MTPAVPLTIRTVALHAYCPASKSRPARTHTKRTFTSTSYAFNWLQPRRPEKSKSRVGRPRMPTGGSMRGTTVVWGDYGLRMKDHDRRVSAKQLKIGEETILKRLRGLNYKLYKRVSANIGVYTSGNEVRMGKGKGKFDYWAARIPVSRIVFELKGDLHEKVAREAFRLAGHKLPGIARFLKLMTAYLSTPRPMGVCDEGRCTYCWLDEVERWNNLGRLKARSQATKLRVAGIRPCDATIFRYSTSNDFRCWITCHTVCWF